MTSRCVTEEAAIALTSKPAQKPLPLPRRMTARTEPATEVASEKDAGGSKSKGKGMYMDRGGVSRGVR